ncbi:MAG: CPBP family intramembrane metalloprotease [Bacteroidaceae bacterium]|nr:CPBP family intramembrane metalloprotease [Bacteroidaceae bacterium]
MRHLLFAICLAALFWFLMFFPHLNLDFNFWAVMTGASLTLTVLAITFGGWPLLRIDWRGLVLGVGIAVVLWCVFWTGDKCSQLLFNFARPQVDMIYGIKDGSSATIIGLLLLFVIGPGEEIFWRGYVQEHLCHHFIGELGETKKAQTKARNLAFICATAAYTLIHVPSLNFMLVMAALVCGLAWGLLYRLMPQHFTAIVLSHALWDAAAFVWFPF